MSPPSQGPFPIGTTVTYQVKVANTDPFNGWDIMIKTNPSAINPTSLTITPNILSANYSSNFIYVAELTNCVNGGAGIPQGQPGNMGCSIDDGPGVVHSAVVGAGTIPASNVNGTLFTMTYTAGGDSLSSVAFSKDTIVNQGQFVQHSTIGGVYGSAQLPFADFNWTPLNPVQGEQVLFNASSSFDPNLGARIVSYTWDFGDSTPPVTTAVPAATHVFKSGTFAVILSTTDSLGISALRTHSVTVAFTPPPPDFFIGWDFAPGQILTIPAGSSIGSVIRLASRNGFSGNVNLTASVSPVLPNGPAPTPNPAVVYVRLGSGGLGVDYATSNLTISTITTTPPGTYEITVIGTSGKLSHSLSVPLVVAPFSVKAEPASLIVGDGGSGRSVITIGSINGFTGPVTLQGAVECLPFLDCKVSFSRDTIALTANETTSTLLTVSVSNGTSAGAYLIRILARSGPYFLDAFIRLDVPLLDPVFVRQGLSWTHALSLSRNGNTQAWTAKITNLNGGDLLVMKVHISAVSEGGISFTADSERIVLNPGETIFDIRITHVFNSSEAGLMFTFTATILWGYIEPNRVSSSQKVGSFLIII